MPAIGYFCPVERKNVPFDHFDYCKAIDPTNPNATSGNRAAFSPWMAWYESQKIIGDTRHASLDLTATRMLGCTRRTFIEVSYDYHVDPRNRESMTRGSALHAAAARNRNPDVWITEATDPLRCTLQGKLFGKDVSAVLDCRRRDWTEIVDDKYPNDFSVMFRDKQGGRAKAEHRAQLNIIRLLAGQQDWAIAEGYNPDKVLLTLWDYAKGKASGAKALHAPHMSEEELGDFHPWGGEYSVREIVEWHAWMLAQRAAEVPREEIAAALPLIGESMPAFMCTGCEVGHICADLARKYGKSAVMEAA